MNKLPKIADAEWVVMKVLWNKSPRSFGDVVRELKDTVSWKPKTIQTLLTRLVNKKVISYEVGNRGYLYYPVVSENECAREETKTLLGKIYDGSLNLLVKNFLESNELSQKEIDELEKIIKMNR